MIFLIGILFLLGIFAIFFEAVLPFGVSAVFGFLVIFFSGYLAVTTYGPALGALYCVIATVAALVVARLAIRSGLSWLALKPKILRDPGRNALAPSREPALGDRARVVQPLRPTGAIQWEGQRLSARALQLEREISIGAEVVIRGKDSIFWLVEEPPKPDAIEPAAEH
jgi:membrane-bound ClpP family serine protease